MGGNKGLEGLCTTVEGRFNHNFDVLNNPIYVDPISKDLPEAYPSQLQTDFPHAYVILRAIDPDDKWSFTPNALEGLFNDVKMREYSKLKDLFVSRDFLQGDIGRKFIPKLRDQLFGRFGDSLTEQVIKYLTQVNDASSELQDTTVVGGRYLVNRNPQNGSTVYDLEKDLIQLKLYPATEEGKTLTRTLRDNEVKEMVERPDHLYYARLGTNFSHEIDTQSNIFLGDGEYSGVMIEVKQTELIDFYGRMHPSARTPHLVQVDRVYWKNTDTWYNSGAEFKTAFETAR